MIVAMLDTNIWLDFVFIRHKSGEIPKRLKRSNELRQLLSKERFVPTISKWNLWEFRDVFTRYLLEKRAFEEGYFPIEFRYVRDEVRLTEEDKMYLENVLETIRKQSIYHTSQIRITIVQALIDTGMSMMDAILLYQAIKNPYCRFFVTRDNKLCKTWQAIRTYLPKGMNFELLKLREFIELLNKSKKQ